MTTKIACIRCRVETNHDVVESHSKRYTQEAEPEMGPDWAEGEWEILRCCGCETITFRETWTNSDDIDHESGELEKLVSLYPPRGRDSLPEKPMPNLPMQLRRIYREILKAFNDDSNLLCGAGVRMLVEATCIHLQVTDGLVPRKDAHGNPVNDANGNPLSDRKNNLEGKIFGLAQAHHLTDRHAQVLHEHRFLGNDAVHDFRAGDREALRAAIEVLEHTFENLFELGARERAMRGRGA
ncbi:MAG: DUF4145 domain-containing protein [Myxococcaceae bacterium]|nr:DUF4145 domain-containing protein [Myxococcaceae bacterium]